MDGLDQWDAALLAVAALAAAWKLVKLMSARRDQLVADVQQQIDAQTEAKKQAEKAAKEKEAA